MGQYVGVPKLWGGKKLVIILNIVTLFIPLYILIGFF